jgi:hypothetical protein
LELALRLTGLPKMSLPVSVSVTALIPASPPSITPLLL